MTRLSISFQTLAVEHSCKINVCWFEVQILYLPMFQNCCEDKCKYKVIFNVVLLESNALSWKSLQNFWERYSLRKLSTRFGKNFVPKKIVQNQQFKFREMIWGREMIDLKLLVSYNGPPTKVALRGSAFVVATQQSRRTTLFLRKIQSSDIGSL